MIRRVFSSFASFALLAFFAVLLTGCGNYGYKKDEYSKLAVLVPLGPGTDGKPIDSNQSIELILISPQEGEVVTGSEVAVTFILKNYLLAEKGNHVHLILDNEPYIPWYDTSKPYVFKKVAPGPHVLRAFPSRPWHESWKYPESFSVVRFYVKEKTGVFALDVSQPFVTYSRPKGEYAGEAAKRIILDFWLSNGQLSDGGFTVRYNLDGKTVILTKWEPIWWEGLAPGMHTIVLELLDKTGALVANGWSRTERTFVVKGEEALPSPHH